MILIQALEPRRFWDAGQLDTSFGSAGHTELPVNDQVDVIDADVTASGQVVVTARTERFREGDSIYLWRLRGDGSRDTRFGPNGDGPVVLPVLESFHETRAHTVLTPDFGVVVQVGNLLYKFKNTGLPDGAFGRGGRAIVRSFLPEAVADLDVDPAGRIYVAGADDAGDLRVARYHPDGSLDVSFGPNGLVSPAPQRVKPREFRVRVLGDGAILLGGIAEPTGERSEFIYPAFDLNGVKLKPDGTLDSTYGEQGVFVQQHFSNDFYSLSASSPHITSDGRVSARILRLGDPSPDSFSTAELGPNGEGQRERDFWAADTVRDGSLWAVVDFRDLKFVDESGTILSGPSDAAEASVPEPFFVEHIALQPDGSIIVAGQKQEDDGDTITLRRLFRDDAPAGQLSARTLVAPRETSNRFTVQWRDDDKVDLSTLGDDDLTVGFPDGTRRRARLVSTDVTSDATVINATYRVSVEDGTWDSSDNGRYTVRIERRSVSDANGHFAARRVIGPFYVRIPAVSQSAGVAVPAGLGRITPRPADPPERDGLDALLASAPNFG